MAAHSLQGCHSDGGAFEDDSPTRRKITVGIFIGKVSWVRVCGGGGLHTHHTLAFYTRSTGKARTQRRIFPLVANSFSDPGEHRLATCRLP